MSSYAKEAKQEKSLRKRYNKMVIIDLEKRAFLRNLIKQNTKCEHKQIYTQANAICRRISTSYEEGKISAEEGQKLIFEAHNQMSHLGFPKDVVAAEMHKRLDKLEGKNNNSGDTASQNSTADDNEARQRKGNLNETGSDKYSESYWQDII